MMSFFLWLMDESGVVTEFRVWQFFLLGNRKDFYFISCTQFSEKLGMGDPSLNVKFRKFGGHIDMHMDWHIILKRAIKAGFFENKTLRKY